MGRAFAWLMLAATTLSFGVSLYAQQLIDRNERRRQVVAAPTDEWRRCAEMFPPSDDADGNTVNAAPDTSGADEVVEAGAGPLVP